MGIKDLASRCFAKYVALPVAAIAMMPAVESGLEKITAELGHPVEISTAWAGYKEDIERAEQLLLSGDSLRRKKEYPKSINLLEQAVILYESYELEPVDIPNYAVALTALADSYINWTLDEHFIHKHTLPDSMENLEEGKRLLNIAIGEYNYIVENSPESRDKLKGYMSWAYNLMGKAQKYTGNPLAAVVNYEKAISLNPSNKSAKFNLKYAKKAFRPF